MLVCRPAVEPDSSNPYGNLKPSLDQPDTGARRGLRGYGEPAPGAAGPVICSCSKAPAHTPHPFFSPLSLPKGTPFCPLWDAQWAMPTDLLPRPSLVEP